MTTCLVSAPAFAQDYFDWRNINGQDFTTPIKDQGATGACWAFAAVGAMECKAEITANLPDWNPDGSEQHLICSDKCGSISSGWVFKALNYIRDTGVVQESELPYTASNESLDWPLEPGWEDRVFRIDAYEKVLDCTTSDVKSALETYGPLAANVSYGDFFHPATGNYLYTPNGAMNHSVVVIGYQDDPDMASEGYWIIKNSWGDDWSNYDGYGFLKYGDIEKFDSVYAITGDAYFVPEPIFLPLLGLTMIVLRRRRR
jgi:C1A family cysteine protease